MGKVIELPIDFGKNTTSSNEFIIYYFKRNQNGKYKFRFKNIIDYSFDIQFKYCDTFIVQKGKIIPALEVFLLDEINEDTAGCRLFEAIGEDEFKEIGMPFNNVFYSKIEAEEFAKYLCEKYPIEE